MTIINLTDFTEITEKTAPAQSVRAMFIHQTDENGAPQVYEIKDWHPHESKQNKPENTPTNKPQA